MLPKTARATRWSTAGTKRRRCQDARDRQLYPESGRRNGPDGLDDAFSEHTTTVLYK
jgi:hypothetical protein